MDTLKAIKQVDLLLQVEVLVPLEVEAHMLGLLAAEYHIYMIEGPHLAEYLTEFGIVEGHGSHVCTIFGRGDSVLMQGAISCCLHLGGPIRRG